MRRGVFANRAAGRLTAPLTHADATLLPGAVEQLQALERGARGRHGNQRTSTGRFRWPLR